MADESMLSNAASAGFPATAGSCWYCIRTRLKQERVTAHFLRSDVGIDVFCPFIRFKRARSTGVSRVTEALFPGYLFARFDYVRQYRHVKSTRGVARIIGFGGRPAIVPDEIIEGLKDHLATEDVIEIRSEIQPGEPVQVIQGPFAGIRAVVTRVMPARERVAILLEILGMEREVEVSTGVILPDLDHPLRPKR
jgi:transcriptional antiterminator RfaH